MRKDVKERLDETIKRDKREFNGEINKEVEKDDFESDEEVTENKEINESDYIEKDVNFEKEMDFEEDENFEESNFNLKKLIIILLVLIISLSSILLLWSNGYEIVNFTFNKVSKITEQKESEDKQKIEENTAITPVNLNEIYDKVHLMSNTIIIAEDGQIWGTYEITKDDIYNVRNQLLKNDDYLYKQLSKWIELDFSNSVEVHNYVWKKLGGTVGKAEKLNEEKIQELIEVLSE